MDKIKFVVISDIHLGDPNCTIIKPNMGGDVC
jgi:hypothetical protein